MNARLPLSLLAAALAVPLLAQTPQQPKPIGEVTLFGEESLKVEAATKTEIPISKAPSAVTVVTAKQIAESGARSVPDLLRLVAGVNVRWNPMVQTVDIRGFGENPFSNRILLLIDGSPMNSGDTGGFPLSPSFDYFPIQNIKRVEVVRGPGSSLYGENAYWGVINIVTLSGEDLAGGDAQFFGGSRSTGAINAQYGKKSDFGSIFGSLRLLQSQMPQEFWIDDHSKIKAQDIFIKATMKDLQVSAYRHHDSLDGFDEEFPPETGFPPGSAFASAHDIRQTLDILSLKYNHSPQDAPVTFAADVSYSHRYGMHCAGCHAAQESPDFSGPENHGYQAVGDFRAGLHMIPGHDALVGVELRRLDRAEHIHELSPGSEVVSGYNKIAIYAQDQFEIVKNTLRAVAGVRFDQKTKLFSSKTSPRLALVYTPVDRLVVRGGYSTAFRFPTFSELYQASWFLTISNEQNQFIPAFPIAVFAPNPNLKPEEISTFELGGEYQISPTVSAKLDLYRSKVKNFIVIVDHFLPPPAPSAVGWENQPADARITGAEFEMRGNFSNTLTGFANWTHQSESQEGAGVDTSGRPFEFVYSPKDKLNVGAYAGPVNGVRGALEVAWRGKAVAPANWTLVRTNFTQFAPIEIPSYALVNARLSYDLPMAMSGKQPVRLSLFGHNLLDKKIEETVIGSPSRIPGREFFAQIEVHF